MLFFQEKKNQVVLGALVSMVALAGYLNYIDSGDSESIAIADNGQIISDIMVEDNIEWTTPVFSETDEEVAISSTYDQGVDRVSTDQASKESDAIFVNATTSADSLNDAYFVDAKLEREQARAKEKDFLLELTSNDSLDTAKRNEAADEILKIQQRIEKETAAEALIESKGFKNAYVRIDNETVDVVVDKEELSDAELAQIEDIVKRKTGYDASQIRISTFKVNK